MFLTESISSLHSEQITNQMLETKQNITLLLEIYLHFPW